MFDFHLHSSLSFDSECDALSMLKKAETLGLHEICFTDHYDNNPNPEREQNIFTNEEYSYAYDRINSDKLKVRLGVEVGLLDDNKDELENLLTSRNFDFVIGSVHFANEFDPYDDEFWYNRTAEEAVREYFQKALERVKIHDNFDVLGHLNYVCKYAKETIGCEKYFDLTDEIMKILIAKGKGLEINTSGMHKIGDFLPSRTYISRFKELGGEIVTVGSDSHNDKNLGAHIPEAIETLKDIFGYVCTFEQRKPIFHKI